jgi:hypothetical protein
VSSLIMKCITFTLLFLISFAFHTLNFTKYYLESRGCHAN